MFEERTEIPAFGGGEGTSTHNLIASVAVTALSQDPGVSRGDGTAHIGLPSSALSLAVAALQEIPADSGEQRYGHDETDTHCPCVGRCTNPEDQEGDGFMSLAEAVAPILEKIRDEFSGEGTTGDSAFSSPVLSVLSNIPCSAGGDGTASRATQPIGSTPAVASIPGVPGGSGTATPRLTSTRRMPATAQDPADGGDDGTAIDPVTSRTFTPAVIITESGQTVRLRTRSPRIDPGLAGGGGTATLAMSSRRALPATARRLNDDELSALISSIRTDYFDKITLQQQAVATVLRAHAYCRTLCEGDREDAAVLFAAVQGKGDHRHVLRAAVVVLPMLATIKNPDKEGHSLAKAERALDLKLEKLVRQLPAYRFVVASSGLGLSTFAGIIGEAGNLSNYSNPAKLWKRMGLAVMADGRRQRRVKGLSEEQAYNVGYVARRRALIWNMGNSLMRASGPLKGIYDARKPFELEKTAAIAADPALCKKWGNKETGAYAPVKHAHDRAKRYMEKKTLLALWIAWRLDRGETNSPLPKGTDPFEMAV